MVGRSLGQYEIVERLGSGGMGIVYKARDSHLDRFVAIKVLPPEATSSPERHARFVQEAKAASGLNHPHIVHIYDIAVFSGTEYIAMEYVPGRTLEEVIGRKGLRLTDALRYAIQIADALAAAHSAGVVHRDLKPGNIMITPEGKIKVVDFGLAKLVRAGESLEPDATRTVAPATQDGTILGTVAYMSPEQAEGKIVDARSDLFSLGAVLYEMLSGRRAFQGDSKLSTMAAILHEQPKPIEHIPAELERVIARCLRKDPARRFQTAADLKVALEEVKEESESGQLLAAVGAKPKSGRWWLYSVITLAILGCVGALWFLLIRSRPQPAGNPSTLTRLTFDSGVTTEPALSRDGKLLAYVSDRGSEGQLSLWLQQVSSGNAVRLTHSAEDEHSPAFSPDGAKIAFRSERAAGGIYIIPTLGGDARLLARDGRDPQFSPDGETIAFWIGSQLQLSPAGVYVVPVTGGTPRQLQLQIPEPTHPVWSPDGKHLLLYSVGKWFTVPTDGGAAVDLHGAEMFSPSRPRTGLPLYNAWTTAGDVLTSLDNNLARVRILQPGRPVTGSFEKITFGSAEESLPSASANGDIAFVSSLRRSNIFRVHLKQGIADTEPQALTHDNVANSMPSVSADGRRLVYKSTFGSRVDIRTLDLEHMKDSLLVADIRVGPTADQGPRISRDGASVAYTYREQGRGEIAVIPFTGGVPEKIIEDADRVASWASDGHSIFLDLYLRAGIGTAIRLLDLSSRVATKIIDGKDKRVYSVRHSPDGRWIVFHEQTSQTARTVFAARFRGAVTIPRNEWIPISEGKSFEREPCWSPDGRLIYFLSDRDSFRCIWARRFNAAMGRPEGAAFAVLHLHQARRSLANLEKTGSVSLWTAQDMMYFALGETTSNIWLTQLGGR